jgi:energy-coupling factor transporter transmembrane protein EcfT
MFRYIVLNIIYIFVCAIFADIIIHVCVLFVGRGQSISCDNVLSNPIAVLLSMAFIFDINTNLNVNNKEMYKLTDLRSQVDIYINWHSNSLV